MNRNIPAIWVMAALSCMTVVKAEFEIFLGEAELVPNASPGVQVYPWFPDGHITYIPDSTPGQYQMYWSGSSSYRTTGTSMTNMGNTSLSLSPGPAGSYDNGGAWLMSVFRQSGNNMLGFYHAEDHEFSGVKSPQGIAWKSIVRCTSNDNGVTWTKGEQIITSPNTKPGTPTWGGSGDNCVVYDPVNSRWVCYFQEHFLYMAVSYDPDGAPGTWFKYYNGAFNQPGLGGQNSPVPGLQSRPGANPSVHFNTYLNKWIMVWHSWSAAEGSIWLSTSADMVNWAPPVPILSAVGTEKMWYATIIGSTDTEAGQQAWLCYAYWPDQSQWPRQFLRRSITFQSVGPPMAPTGLVAVAGEGSVSLDWDDSGDLNLSHYNVYRSTTSGSGYMSIASGQASSDYVDHTAGNGTTYYYVVTAVNNSGEESAYSVQVAATPTVDVSPPVPNPASFASGPIAVGDGSVTMTATTGTDPSGPVEYLFTETTGNPGGTSSGWQTSPTYTDTGLAVGTQYAYTVRMKDALGHLGTASGAANVTTQLQGLLTNGDFSNGKSSWFEWTYTGGGRTANFSVVNGELVVSQINGGGTANWISVLNGPVNLVQGKSYRVTFDARSAAQRFISVAPRRGSGTYADYSTRQIQIGTSMKTYSFIYTHTPASDPTAQLIFYLGLTNDTVYLDNVNVYETVLGSGSGPTIKLLQIGDSITQGNIYGAGTYRKPLFFEMQSAGYNVDLVGSHNNMAGNSGPTSGLPDSDTTWDQDHEGWWGYTTAQVESILTTSISTYDFDVALIHLGTNDPNTAGIQNLKDIIDLLRTDNPKVVIFLAQLIAPNFSNTAIATYNGMIPAVVAEKNTQQSPVILVNQYPTLAPGTSDYADGLHPSATGAVKMAAVWLQAINDYYSEPAAQFAVTYDGNGSTGGDAPADQTKISGTDLTLAANTGNLVLAGSSLLGWNTQPDGNGTDYAEGANYTTDADLTLYAKWNAVPVADDDSVTTDKDMAVAITLTASDADDDALTYTVVTGPANGTLSGAAPDLTYMPDFHFSGSDSFTFKVNDGTEDSNTATVSITVHGVRVLDYAATTPGTVKTFKVALLMINTRTAPIADNPGTNQLEFYTPEKLGQLFFEHEHGANSFIKEASYGKIALEGRVVGWIDEPVAGLNGTDISSNASTYLSLANAYLTYSDYDVFVVHSLVEGSGQQTGWLYPQQSFNTPQGQIQNIGITWMANSNVFDFAPLLTSNWSSGDAVLPTTSWAHELLHTFGITGHANSYDCGSTTLDLSSASDPVKGYGGVFSIMGEYAFGTHPDALMKSRLGWLSPAQIPDVTSTGTYEIHPLTVNDGQIKALVIPLATRITHSQNAAEFDALVVEYRTASGFDRYLERLNGSPFLSQYTMLTDIDTNGVVVYMRYGNTATDATALLDMNPTTTFNPDRGIKIQGNPGKFADSILPVNNTFTWGNIQITPLGTTGAGAMGVNVTISPPNPYVAWTQRTFAKPFTDVGTSMDPDGDSMFNFMEFAFGTDPTVSASGPMVHQAGGNVITPGLPVAVNLAEGGGADFHAVFSRRKDYLAAGLGYTVQFSADLNHWITSSDAPIVLTDPDGGGDVDAVSVPFPLLIPVEGGQKTPTFFRVGVSME